jgi:hypothetical protein
LVDGHSGGLFDAGDGGEEDYGLVVVRRLALSEVDGCYSGEVEGGEEVYI